MKYTCYICVNYNERIELANEHTQARSTCTQDSLHKEEFVYLEVQSKMQSKYVLNNEHIYFLLTINNDINYQGTCLCVSYNFDPTNCAGIRAPWTFPVLAAPNHIIIFLFYTISIKIYKS